MGVRVNSELIITSRIILRLLNEDTDAEMILTLLNQASFLRNIGDKQVRNLDDAKAYINSGPLTMQSLHGYSMYCCEHKGSQEPFGLCGLIKRDGIEYPEIGFSFLEKYFRQGYGKESSLAVLEHTKTHLKIPTLNAITSLHNLASNNLLTSIGFNYQKLITVPSIKETLNLFELSLYST